MRVVVERFLEGQTKAHRFLAELEHAVLDNCPRDGYTDPAIDGLFDAMDWFYEDPFRSRYIYEGGLSESIPFLERCLLFLKSDLEYVWPTSIPWKNPLRPILRLISKEYRKRDEERRKQVEIWRRAQEEEYWPFASYEEYC